MFGGATILMWYHSQTLFLMLHSQIALSSEVASSACLVVWLSEVPHMCRGMMPRTLICRGFTTLVPILLLLALLGWSRIEDWLVSRPSLFPLLFPTYICTQEREPGDRAMGTATTTIHGQKLLHILGEISVGRGSLSPCEVYLKCRVHIFVQWQLTSISITVCICVLLATIHNHKEVSANCISRSLRATQHFISSWY